ncbi:MAG: hypothetical protein ISR78_04705 [Spirochaetia bacterium]|nr:hypothetical protein [Spirochaetia bacterium]
MATQVKNWPTPAACMSKGTNQKALTRKDGKSRENDRLDHKVLAININQLEKKKYPTPTAADSTKGGKVSPRPGAMGLSETTGGQLNPDWVEWLMGWPIGWSSLDQLGNIDFPTWQSDPADTGDVPRVGKNIPNRAKRLKAIGNGQVPQVVAIAFSILSEGI